MKKNNKFKFYFSDKISKIEIIKIKDIFKQNNLEINEKDPDIIIVIGGDGTFLKCIQIFGLDIKYIFLSTGKIGFHRTMVLKDLFNDGSVINRIINENNIENIRLLEIKEDKRTSYAINEVRFFNTYKTLVSDIYLDGQILKKNYAGSGIYISTAYGSTGFNSSYGHGPWLFMQENNILNYLEPINNKIYNQYTNPIIYNHDSEIIIDNLSQNNNHLIFDNTNLSTSSKKIIIRNHNKCLKLYRISNDYTKLWREKLLESTNI